MSKVNKILDKIETGELTPEEAVDQIEKIKANTSDKQNGKTSVEILKDIEAGVLTAEEGAGLIANIEKENKTYTKGAGLPDEEDLKKISRWWRYPWILGLVLFIGSGLGMNSFAQSSGLNFWFFLLILPLLLGVILLVLTWPSENKPWIHVRVRERSGSRVNISIPLPVKFASGVFKLSRNFMPLEVSEKINPDQFEVILDELAKGRKLDNPFHVHVDEGDGEVVDVYIG